MGASKDATVTNSKLRAAYRKLVDAGELDGPADLASRLGWMRETKSGLAPDAGKVRHRLRLDKSSRCKRLTPEEANAIAGALHLDPVDLGF